MNEPDTSALRIAVLEGDALLRERILLPRLREHGFEVTGLATAAALRALLATTAPDIVVLDVALPDDDGFSVAQLLRYQRPALGVVMLMSDAPLESDSTPGWNAIGARGSAIRHRAGMPSARGAAVVFAHTRARARPGWLASAHGPTSPWQQCASCPGR